MQAHLGHHVRDNNGYQAAISSSQVESDFVRRIFSISISAFSESRKEFSLVVKHFRAFFPFKLFSSLPSVGKENLNETRKVKMMSFVLTIDNGSQEYPSSYKGMVQSR